MDGSGYRAIAFWMDHRKKYNSITTSEVFSIDELEEMTGVDFFVNLASVVGAETAAAIEAQDPVTVSAWGI